MTTRPDPLRVRLFVYGSLQPGAWNCERFFREDPPAHRAIAWGDVSYAWDSPEAYPVARFRDKPATPIFGHVLLLDALSPEWARVSMMEHGAGYRLVETEVALEVYASWSPPEGIRGARTALAFEYDGPVVPRLAVPGGDWLACRRDWYNLDI